MPKTLSPHQHALNAPPPFRSGLHRAPRHVMYGRRTENRPGETHWNYYPFCPDGYAGPTTYNIGMLFTPEGESFYCPKCRILAIAAITNGAVLYEVDSFVVIIDPTNLLRGLGFDIQ